MLKYCKKLDVKYYGYRLKHMLLEKPMGKLEELVELERDLTEKKLLLKLNGYIKLICFFIVFYMLNFLNILSIRKLKSCLSKMYQLLKTGVLSHLLYCSK